MHLIPTSARLYLKPVPRFLLDPRFWQDHLRCMSETSGSFSPPCEPCQARRCATGFLLSYAALVSHESEFMISQHYHLLPKEMTWPKWRTFLQQLFKDPSIHDKINPRFDYGELRLRRLDNICRYRYIVDRIHRNACVTSIRGYNYGYSLHSEPWIVSITVYIALVLTAMQVGLATNQSKDNNIFQAASYGFAVFSIVAPLILAMFLGAALILITGFSHLMLLALNSSMVSRQVVEVVERLKEKRKQAHEGHHQESQSNPEQTHPSTTSSPPV